jgi:hypothetical protein
MANVRVNWFSDVLQVDFQRKGLMVDGQVDNFSRALNVLKEKTLIVNRR